MESDQWLELFHPFMAVKDLHIIQGPARPIALALQELSGERVTGVLPALQNISLPKRDHKTIIGQFVAGRQLFS